MFAAANYLSARREAEQAAEKNGTDPTGALQKVDDEYNDYLGCLLKVGKFAWKLCTGDL